VRVMEIKSEVVITPLFNTEQVRAPADIFVENFIRFLYSMFIGEYITGVCTDGEECTIGGGSRDCKWGATIYILYTVAPEGDDSYGVIVGASSEEEKMDNYNLIAKYPHGTGTNQIFYGSSEVEDLGYDEENKRHVIRIRRWFENRGTSDIVINEVGLVAFERAPCIGDSKFLISRCVLPTTFTLPVGRMMYVDYFIYLHF